MNDLLNLIGLITLWAVEIIVSVTLIGCAIAFGLGGPAKASAFLKKVWSGISIAMRAIGKAFLKSFLKILGAISLKVSQLCQAGVRRL